MSSRSLDDALQKLTKWRRVFASWQLGTRPNSDGEFRAVTDHREATILLRAEVNTMLGLMLAKGLITEQEWNEALEREAAMLDRDYEQRFPGYRSTAHGMDMKMPAALETMRRLGFPA